MTRTRIKLTRPAAQRRRDALVRAGIAPSGFGRKKPAQPHRDRKREAARGEGKNNRRDWE